MRKLLILLGLGFWAACGPNDAVKAAQAMADAVCACPDQACAEAAHRKGHEEAMRHKDSHGSRADAEAIEAAGKRTSDCLSRLRPR